MSGAVQSMLEFALEPARVKRRRRAALGCAAWYQTRIAKRFARQRGRDLPFEKVLGGEAVVLLGDRAFQRRLDAAERADDRIFLLVSTLVNRIFARYVSRMAAAGSIDLVRSVKELVALVSSNLFVSLPYLLSYFHQSSDRMIVRDVRRSFGLAERERLVLVTDTYFEINGVASTIRRMIDEARRREIDLTVVTCLGADEMARATSDPAVRRLVESGQLRVFPSIVNLDFPAYDELQIRFPPFLDFVKFLQEQGFTKMQISTPGTIGVAGLLAAKLLQIETSSTYHTSFPEYVENYTQDISLEALAWKYMILFYHSVDEVVVPSRFIAQLLHKRGLRNRKLLVLDRWVDTERFHPSKRTPGFWDRFGITDADRLVKFVYVGRVSVEKNLDLLADAFRNLCQAHGGVHLIVIGDGPHRAKLEHRLAGLPVTFCGYLTGEELATGIASADAKLFPSTTDTWGNAPLEAQASGLPVVVSDQGGPQELMEDGVTGFRICGRDVDALVAAMERLLDPQVRTAMGRAARAFAEHNRVERPYSAILESEVYRRRRREQVLDTTAEEAEPPVPDAPIMGAGRPVSLRAEFLERA